VDGSTVKNATALDGTGQGYGILISGYDAYNNWVSNNTVGPVIRHAILIQGAHNNLIENNRITGTVSGAIDLHGEDEYANEIRYNVISDGVRNGTTVSPNGAGIEVGEYSGVIGTTTMHDNSGPGNYIHDNTVYNYSYGFRITNNSNYTFVEDNVFYDNDEVGILANLAPLNNLYLSGNEVYNNAHGILLYNVTQAVVTDNYVHDNPGIGIGIDAGSTGYVITGNTAINNGMNVYLGNPYGVYVPGPTSAPVGILPL
jgi:parallel beta-helix repeat protein